MPDPSQTYNIKRDVNCADFVGHDQNISYGFTAGDVERLIDKVLAFWKAGASFIPEDNGSLHAELDGESLVFHPSAALRLAGQHDERSYLLSLTVHQEYLVWATNFIPLKARADKKRALAGLDIPLALCEVHVPPPGSGPDAQITTEPLEDITDALGKHDVFIVLGEPGAGKTTTLQKMVYDQALACLENSSARVPLFTRLSSQGDATPYEFLEKEWKKRTGGDFGGTLSTGRVLLLLDGVNELPLDKRAERLNDWRIFVKQDCGACQVVFSGRKNDYEGSLDLPNVLIEPLDNVRIAGYLKRNHAEGLLDLLNDENSGTRRLRDLAKNPLNLSLLAYYFRENGKSLDNRGGLFAWFTEVLMAREKRDHPDNIPIEVRRVALEKLAYAAREKGETTTLPLITAKMIVPTRVEYKGEPFAVDPVELFRFSRGAKILDPSLDQDVRFQHQLLQEYFAALELLRRFDAGEDLSFLWQAKRAMDEMPPTQVGEWDELPEPPSTGWEVTSILAVGLAADPAKLIETIRLHNPVLAGRCLDEAGIEKPAEVTRSIQADLLTELYNPNIHVRARLQAGFVLGRIGDPRFTSQEIGGIKVVLPQMVQVPGGIYTIGSAERDPDAYDNERPKTRVDLPAFAIGKWPVTNAEYACFMEAGGYRDEQYWQTSQGRHWLKGDDAIGGQMKTFLDERKTLLDNPIWHEMVKDLWTPQQIKGWEYAVSLSDDEAEKWYSSQLSQKSRVQPAYWNDPQYNNPSQPVVGVTWFEANAYCAWLSAVSEKLYRLPTEAEWEAAARGIPLSLKGMSTGQSKRRAKGEGELRVYPWGDEWDAAKTNTIEGRALKPSPVGTYSAAGGLGPFGVEDQVGNVWNWTRSLFLPYTYDPVQSENSESELVLRGGSWSNNRGLARCAYRGRDLPAYFGLHVGFRIVSPGNISDS